jgi:hypothetical protein
MMITTAPMTACRGSQCRLVGLGGAQVFFRRITASSLMPMSMSGIFPTIPAALVRLGRSWTFFGVEPSLVLGRVNNHGPVFCLASGSPSVFISLSLQKEQ